MTHFKRAFARLLRPKCRKQLRQPGESNLLSKLAHPGEESTDRSVVEPSTDVVVEEVEESETEDEVNETHLEVGVQTTQHSTDAILTKVEGVEESKDGDSHDKCVDDEDEDIPEVFPYDLVHKTHRHEVVRGLYVAVSDNDCEIAALRTVHRARFTHIIRVVFNPLSRNNITPSSWAVQEVYPDGDGPHELRLTCPPLMRHYDGKLTALRENQLLATRNYIAQALPHRSDMWAEQGHKHPFSLEEGEDTRLLVIAPPNRSADVMAILVCYISFLVGMSAEQVLGGLRPWTLIHSHWGGDILSKDSLDMVNVVSKHK